MPTKLSERTWLNAEQAAEYCGLPSAAAWCEKAKRLARSGLRGYWLGGTKLWSREEIDSFILNTSEHGRVLN